MLRRSRNLIPIPPQFDGPSSEASLELVKAKEYYAQDPRPDKAFDFEVYGEAEVRNALMKLFNNKCAYCEIKFVRCSPHVDPGQSGEARIFLIQDDNLTAEVPLRRSILQSTLRQKYRSTGRHNPQRDGGPEKGLYRLHPIALRPAAKGPTISADDKDRRLGGDGMETPGGGHVTGQRLLRENAVVHGPDRGLGTVVDVDLAQQGLQVDFDCRLGDAEPVGDQLV